jgi:hypothetical protein
MVKRSLSSGTSLITALSRLIINFAMAVSL